MEGSGWALTVPQVRFHISADNKKSGGQGSERKLYNADLIK